MACRWLVGSWVVALSLFGATAHAEEKARLVYVRGAGADDCPAEVDLRLWVMARLGYDPFSPQASRVVLSRLEARGEQLVGSLEVVDQGGMSTGQRELTAQLGHCQELARALALSISLAIDPERASQPPAAKSSGSEPAAPAPAPTVSEEPKPAPPAAKAPPALKRPRAFASLAVAPAVGVLPSWSLGGALGVGLRFGSLAVAAEGVAARSLAHSLEPRGELSGSLLGGGVSACWSPEGWDFCGVGVAGAQKLGASEVTSPTSSTGLLVGVGPRVAKSLRLGPQLEFVVGLQALLNLSRNSALLSGREVWRTPLVSGTLQLGLRTRFL